MAHDHDITALVAIDDPDGEDAPLRRCVCGQTYGYWEFVLSIYRDSAHACIRCGRRLYISIRVHVFEVVDGL